MLFPLVEELPNDLPFDTLISRFASEPHLLVLDSADPHPERGRYSFLSAAPSRFLTRRLPFREDPFAEVHRELAGHPLETVPGLPPFQGGVAGLFGYGLAHAVERLPPSRADEFRLPALAVGVYDWVVSRDHLENRTWLVSTGMQAADEADRPVVARERMEWVRAKLGSDRITGPCEFGESGRIAKTDLVPQFPLFGDARVTSNFSRAGYLDAVRRAVEYVHAGDCFQVNLSQRLLAPLNEHPLELYFRLRERNPAPFAGYLSLDEFAILSASPERFLKVIGREVETRPIKGTRPRGESAEEDAGQIRELAASPKDRAENVMIVDLLRNDLGRVCEYGSVRVPRVCEVETYRFVHHLVSDVRGRLRPDRSLVDLLRASFPGGSVTGAPKVRAMEIIAELEPTARGPYCGSLGYLGFDGSMDTNILIRTFTAGRGWVQFPVGGGIVADSEPEREYEETLHKARGMLRAL
jgi:para-aminobenzoate synthetase component I